ncbi:MAG: hypothetical protein QXU74_00910 [Candidatus Aenigmatarchaeota archaeon]
MSDSNEPIQYLNKINSFYKELYPPILEWVLKIVDTITDREKIVIQSPYGDKNIEFLLLPKEQIVVDINKSSGKPLSEFIEICMQINPVGLVLELDRVGRKYEVSPPNLRK